MLTSIIVLGTMAAAAPWISRALGRFAGPLFALVAGGIFLWFTSSFAAVTQEGGAISEATAWLPSFGVDLAFRLDGLSLLFAMLITGIGSLILLYASDYLKDHHLRHRFFAFLIAFMTAMLGVVTADNLVLLFVFWELTSMTSFLLIGFDHDKEESRKSAVQALLVTGLGGLVLLAGVFLLGIAAGNAAGVQGGLWRLSEVLEVEGLTEQPLFLGAMICLLGGAFTKSAQFPFHFWLPNAMAAPTPVSAYLHSSTMVKAGVYLVMRLNPAFDDSLAWSWTLAGFGATTMVVGAVLAARETYFKKVLAYSTVSSLGIMVMFTGVSGEIGAEAAVGYLLAHALFKACLFLIAGSTTHATGSKDIETLGGLRRAMPLTAAAALIGGLSMAGAPPLLGFVGKELLLKATTHPPESFILWKKAVVLTGMVTVSAVLTVMVSVLVGWRPFFAKPKQGEPAEAHALSWRMVTPPVVLALLTLVGPLVPRFFAAPLIEGGMASLGHPAEYPIKIALWDLMFPFAKFSAAFALSIGALFVGTWLYLIRARWRPTLQKTLALINPISPLTNYDRVLKGTLAFGRWQTKVVQSGKLSRYVTAIVLTTVGLSAWALIRSGDPIQGYENSGRTFLDVTLLVLMAIGAVASTRYRSRLAAIASLGVVGYCVAVIFVVLGVPDIAMTQFSIETLTVIIFVLVIYALPRFNVYSGGGRRIFDAGIALAFGATVTVLVLTAQGNSTLATATQAGLTPISQTLGELSYVEAFGKNVVNVILVDFRGMDTMGEITVLGIAAIGIFTLLKLRPESQTAGTAPLPRLTESPADTKSRSMPNWMEAEQ
ncbi:MAG: hydrogen gas-evolving membrane-bound hydrogenase subunit E [Planctomycetota bacterium]